MPMPANEVYRQLATLKQGIPQFTPEPNENLPVDYQRVGVSICDVGVWRNGSFEVLFNAATNERLGVPNGLTFEPFVLDPHAVSRRAHYHSPGAVISTARAFEVSLGVGGSLLMRASILPTSAGSSITLRFRSKVGAALLLPNGASRQELLPIARFGDYVRENAETWYAFGEASGYLHRHNASNSADDALFVVTGCDKTSAWAIGTASSASVSVGFSLKIGFASLAEGTLEPRFEWAHETAPTVRTSRGDVETENQCVFVRGFFIRRQPAPSRWKRMVERLALGADMSRRRRVNATREGDDQDKRAA